MEKVILTIAINCILFTCFGQNNGNINCRTKWIYQKTTHKIIGTLIDFKPVADCGYSMSASLSIVKTKIGDTIRVLQMCDTSLTAKQNTQVTLLPNSQIDNYLKASIIPTAPETDCIVRNTYFGTLLKE
jgi:hypothetical protein